MQLTMDGCPDDEILAEAAVHVTGEAASRLLRGERVTVTVTMQNTSMRVTSLAAQPAGSEYALTKKGRWAKQLSLHSQAITTHAQIVCCSC